MATWDLSGCVTLGVLLGIGPLFYILQGIYNCLCGGPKKEEVVEQIEGERKTVKTIHYLFALVGYAIGIGNVWRFPYVIATNGGAAAILAYMVCAFLVSWPLFLYEMILGQFSRLSANATYKAIHPRWESLGIAQFLLCFITLSFYMVIVSYTLPYILGSLMDPLPWIAVPAQTYFDDLVAGNEGDTFVMPILYSLIIMWVVVFFSVSFGKEILAKVTYITVISPLILTLILVVRTAFLPGAGDGIYFYIGKFEYEYLYKVSTWSTACSQVLFSLSPGFGTAITMSSFTDKKADIVQLWATVAISNTVFSIISGFGIFSILGNVAYNKGLPVEEVASAAGFELAFVMIAEAMQYFGPYKNIMSVFFFFMLFTLGLDSAFAWLETLTASIEDMMHDKGMAKKPEWLITLLLALTSFGIGLTFTTVGGFKYLDVLDHFVSTTFLLIVCFFESVMLNMNFGYPRLATALKASCGRSLPTCLCRIDFHITVPAFTFFLGFYTLYTDIRVPYGGYSTKLLQFGWGSLIILIGAIPLTWFKGGKTIFPTAAEMEDTASKPPSKEKDIESKQVEVIPEEFDVYECTDKSDPCYPGNRGSFRNLHVPSLS